MGQSHEFFANHPVFSTDEFDRFLQARGRKVSPAGRDSLLRYHKLQGRIVPVRKGLYASIPPGRDPDRYPVDPFLIASRLAPDAVLAYHTALEIHGVAYSPHTSRVLFVTARRHRGPFEWRGVSYHPVKRPAALRAREQPAFGVQTVDRRGEDVAVTTIERTVVDVLDRPDLGGGWEEISRSLASIDYLVMPRVIEYVALLGNATTAAKVGYFLEAHREQIGVENDDLKELEAYIPKAPHYLERTHRRSGILSERWNLVVPRSVMNKSWEEVL